MYEMMGSFCSSLRYTRKASFYFHCAAKTIAASKSSTNENKASGQRMHLVCVHVVCVCVVCVWCMCVVCVCGVCVVCVVRVLYVCVHVCVVCVWCMCVVCGVRVVCVVHVLYVCVHVFSVHLLRSMKCLNMPQVTMQL